MRYAVTDVQVPLDSVSQICDTGATVTFTSQGGTITGAAYAVDFERRGDTYVRTTWVKVPVPQPDGQLDAEATAEADG